MIIHIETNSTQLCLAEKKNLEAKDFLYQPKENNTVSVFSYNIGIMMPIYGSILTRFLTSRSLRNIGCMSAIQKWIEAVRFYIILLPVSEKGIQVEVSQTLFICLFILISQSMGMIFFFFFFFVLVIIREEGGMAMVRRDAEVSSLGMQSYKQNLSVDHFSRSLRIHLLILEEKCQGTALCLLLTFLRVVP